MKPFAENRRALFDHEILESMEAGLELRGFEVKAIRNGFAQIAGAHVLIRGNEAFLLNAIIPPYQPANVPAEYDPARTRRLLLARKEIAYLTGKTHESGLTIVPIRLYGKGRTIKLQIGLVRRKKKADKRGTIQKREARKSIARTLKSRI